MPMIRQNRLIPILALCVLVIAGIVALRSREPTPSHVPMTDLPQPPAPAADADTPADTIRTLTAEVKSVQQQNVELRERNSRLAQQNDELNRNRTAIEENVTRRLTERFSRPEASGSPVFSDLSRRIDDLAATVQRYAPETTTVPAAGADIPPGLGFDAGGSVADAANPGPAATSPLVWSEPLGSRTVVGSDGRPKTVRLAEAGPGANEQPPAARDTAAEPAQPEPYFTLPENATLMDATAMTALIGRAPVGGNVRDPMEFKVLIGRTNLAANGFELPDDVTGMVVSGVAIGDWMLSCVEGHVNSVTFVFDDGSIRTVSKRGSGGGNAGRDHTQRLGYVSDERGAPCLSGDRITNAPAYLTQIVGIKSLEVAARAAALSQTTTVTNGLGSSTAVTGSTGQFVLGQAAAAGVDEVSNWLLRRLNDSFDAVYVRPGGRLAVHLTEAITLDKDPDARRLDHGRLNDRSAGERAELRQLD